MQLWVDGYAVPGGPDDGYEWLTVTAECVLGDSSARVSGDYVDVASFERFSRQLGASLTGPVHYALLMAEPEIAIEVSSGSDPGRLFAVVVTLRAGNVGDGVVFAFEASAKDLERAVDQCAAIVAAYPNRK